MYLINEHTLTISIYCCTIIIIILIINYQTMCTKIEIEKFGRSQYLCRVCLTRNVDKSFTIYLSL